MYSCSCCSSLIEIQDFQGMPCISHPWYSTMIHAGHEPEKHEKTRLCVSCFLNMFYCLVSFAVNVLVSIFSWVLPRWPLGNLARDLAIKTTMGHTGKAWQSHHCSSVWYYSIYSFRRKTGWVDWYLLRILNILGLLERPLNDLMNWSATSQADDLRALATSTSILCGGVWFV